MTTSYTNTKENPKDYQSCARPLNRGGYINYSDQYDPRFGKRDGFSDGSSKIGVETPVLGLLIHKIRSPMS